ncbi:MAG: exonuclease domain-containing protein [Lachnospiraceae bacterium]|nr:exonuclease domain-containing protein [Lachnospiraceae bacterium]
MKWIVLDLEWNQSSSGKEPEVARIPFEIIEIGAIQIGENGQMTGEFSELVKPQVYRKMHSYTSKLIHLQMQELEKGHVFPEVWERFQNWIGTGEDYMFCTWGPSDLTELQRNLAFYDLPPIRKGPIPFLDAQKLYTLCYEEDRKARRNLEHAVDALGIEKDIPFHRAFSDAYYTAKVMLRMKKDRPAVYSKISYDVTIPPATEADEVEVVFDNYGKYISRVFESREAALSDRHVLSTKCFLCGQSTRRKVKWFSTNGKHYYSVSECPSHGLLKGKIRIHWTEEGGVFVVKTQRLVTKAEAEEILTKRNKAERKLKEQQKQREKQLGIRRNRGASGKNEEVDG